MQLNTRRMTKLDPPTVDDSYRSQCRYS